MMTNDELKLAFRKGLPVIRHDDFLGDITYPYIYSVSYYHKPDGRLTISAELMDHTRHSLTTASPESLSFAGDIRFKPDEAGSPMPTTLSERDVRTAARTMKEFCESQDDCLKCPIHDLCTTDPYQWEVDQADD